MDLHTHQGGEEQTLHRTVSLLLMTGRGSSHLQSQPRKRPWQPLRAKQGGPAPQLLSLEVCMLTLTDSALQTSSLHCKQRGHCAAPGMACKTEVYAYSCASLLGFFLPLSVTSAFCFLSFRMFPNTSCLVRCLRQTERCRWRQCFTAQFVH